MDKPNYMLPKCNISRTILTVAIQQKYVVWFEDTTSHARHVFANPRTSCFRTGMTNSPPRAVFEHALTEEGFLGLAKDTGLLALPFVAHTALIHLFRQHASHMPRRCEHVQRNCEGNIQPRHLQNTSGIHSVHGIKSIRESLLCPVCIRARICLSE